MPALFPRIDDTFELGPMKLAVLTLARAVPQCVLAVLGGFVGNLSSPACYSNLNYDGLCRELRQYERRSKALYHDRPGAQS